VVGYITCFSVTLTFCVLYPETDYVIFILEIPVCTDCEHLLLGVRCGDNFYNIGKNEMRNCVFAVWLYLLLSAWCYEIWETLSVILWLLMFAQNSPLLFKVCVTFSCSLNLYILCYAVEFWCCDASLCGAFSWYRFFIHFSHTFIFVHICHDWLWRLPPLSPWLCPEYCLISVLLPVMSFARWLVLHRSSKKSIVDLEASVDVDGQQTVRKFTIMFSSSGAAAEFRKLFTQVS